MKDNDFFPVIVSDLQADGNNAYATISNGGSGLLIERGIYKTTDGGVSWVAMNNGLIDGNSKPFSAHALAVAASNEIFVSVRDENAGDNIIVRTTDGGASWGQTYISSTLTQALLTTGNIVLAGTNGRGIVRSGDSGSSWAVSNSFIALHINSPLGFNRSATKIISAVCIGDWYFNIVFECFAYHNFLFS